MCNKKLLDKINLKREINISFGKSGAPYITSYSQHETHRLHVRKYEEIGLKGDT